MQRAESPDQVNGVDANHRAVFAKIEILCDANITTIGGLASTSDAQLDALYGVGPAAVQRIKNVVGQAIWI